MLDLLLLSGPSSSDPLFFFIDLDILLIDLGSLALISLDMVKLRYGYGSGRCHPSG
jgi:hypothetical protein